GIGIGIGRRKEEGERRFDGEVEVEQQQQPHQWGEQVSGFASSQGQGQGQGGSLLGLGALRRGIEEEPREHQIARAIVNDCLERGDDSVDLSGGNLRSIPSGLLRPLQHLTKLPAIKEPPVTEDVYTSLEPFLRLFLAGNALPKLCGELFELDTLRVLSLRNNKLTEIPAAIRRLTMLQEVNLSVNRLRSLPWELLWLIRKGDLKHLTVRPNPLLQIDDGAHDPEAAVAEWHIPREELRSCVYEGPAPEQAWAPVHVATGPVRRYNAEGVLLLPPAGSSSQPVGTAMELDAATDTDTDPSTNPQDRPCPTPLPPAASRVPSLREVALLSLTRSPSFDLLSDAELAGYPALMLRLLRDAREVRAAGGRSCSVCHRGFVLARTEWIEWWDCSTYENGLKGPRPSGEGLRPLPFRRLGCSWGCVPGAEI
ncbi:leucine-rich repeat domain-containing protein, partial [Aspergillus fijiensis CBS 313.89]